MPEITTGDSRLNCQWHQVQCETNENTQKLKTFTILLVYAYAPWP